MKYFLLWLASFSVPFTEFCFLYVPKRNSEQWYDLWGGWRCTWERDLSQTFNTLWKEWVTSAKCIWMDNHVQKRCHKCHRRRMIQIPTTSSLKRKTLNDKTGNNRWSWASFALIIVLLMKSFTINFHGIYARLIQNKSQNSVKYIWQCAKAQCPPTKYHPQWWNFSPSELLQHQCLLKSPLHFALSDIICLVRPKMLREATISPMINTRKK